LIIIFFIAGRVTGRLQKPVALLVCLGPAVVLVLVGLVVPAIQTIITSFQNQTSLTEAKTCPKVVTPGFPCGIKNVGFKNYKFDFQDPYTLGTFRHTLLWLVIVPAVTVVIGLLAALLMDRMRHTAVPKTLIFLPTAISLVGDARAGPEESADLVVLLARQPLPRNDHLDLDPSRLRDGRAQRRAEGHSGRHP
jgi:alpha-glucoside transport system permease protein